MVRVASKNMGRITITSVNYGIAWMFILSLGLLAAITLSSAFITVFSTIIGIKASGSLLTLISLLCAYIIFFVILLRIVWPEGLLTSRGSTSSIKAIHSLTKQLFSRSLRIFFILSGLIFLLVYFVETIYEFVSVILESEKMMPSEQLLSPPSNDGLYFILLAIQVLILGPIVEELVYRGFPLLFFAVIFDRDRNEKRISHSWKSKGAALIVSSLTFSFAHLPGDLATNSYSYVLSHQFYLFMLGMILGISFLASRNIFLPIFLHSLNNSVSYGLVVLGAFFPEIEVSSDFFLMIGVFLVLLYMVTWLILSFESRSSTRSLSQRDLANDGTQLQSSSQAEVSFIWFLQLLLVGPGMGFSILLMSDSDLFLVFIGIFTFVVVFFASLVVAIRHAGTITV